MKKAKICFWIAAFILNTICIGAFIVCYKIDANITYVPRYFFHLVGVAHGSLLTILFRIYEDIQK